MKYWFQVAIVYGLSFTLVAANWTDDHKTVANTAWGLIKGLLSTNPKVTACTIDGQALDSKVKTFDDNDSFEVVCKRKDRPEVELEPMKIACELSSNNNAVKFSVRFRCVLGFIEIGKEVHTNNPEDLTDIVSFVFSGFLSLLDSLIDDIIDVKGDLDDMIKPQVNSENVPLTLHQYLQGFNIELLKEATAATEVSSVFNIDKKIEMVPKRFFLADKTLAKVEKLPSKNEAGLLHYRIHSTEPKLQELGDIQILILHYKATKTFYVLSQSSFFRMNTIILSDARTVILQILASIIIQAGVEAFKFIAYLHASMNRFSPALSRKVEGFLGNLFGDPRAQGLYTFSEGTVDGILNFTTSRDSIFFDFLFKAGVLGLPSQLPSTYVFKLAIANNSQYDWYSFVQIYIFNLLMMFNMKVKVSEIVWEYDSIGAILNFLPINILYSYRLDGQLNICEWKLTDRLKLALITVGDLKETWIPLVVERQDGQEVESLDEAEAVNRELWKLDGPGRAQQKQYTNII